MGSLASQGLPEWIHLVHADHTEWDDVDTCPFCPRAREAGLTASFLWDFLGCTCFLTCNWRTSCLPPWGQA